MIYGVRPNIFRRARSAASSTMGRYRSSRSTSSRRANNQLAEEQHGDVGGEGATYAPVRINAAGSE
jgi:hypothetical protein